MLGFLRRIVLRVEQCRLITQFLTLFDSGLAQDNEPRIVKCGDDYRHTLLITVVAVTACYAHGKEQKHCGMCESLEYVLRNIYLYSYYRVLIFENLPAQSFIISSRHIAMVPAPCHLPLSLE